ncbi:hypothetical protein TREMEDRAFT_73534 [Tremella mesenterica DSM 1558]|uniref:uncharacterized protein n=1 Tax=Tremella mesenterica (strain ATCC 24925 / CBS 8224 / DSM 1558 / NBRC 9311 / NRRL Y-6157 / RJB 2259-6 / UBC 559-6) TaxID=578456 RepID=UPI0003F49F81|nr:uncharacterized protein TREMEDRAFT_73534 [Tremella mesenterica DSM 1558]EIW70668.1 hypothetical protein TREMEDRAFT_73534 [Tremella mesenterica DSM 1558]
MSSATSRPSNKEDVMSADKGEKGFTSNSPTKTSSSPKKMDKFLSKLPPWLSSSLKDRRKWKNFLRAWIVFFSCVVLLLDHQTLTVIGQAAFFLLIVSIMLPPTFPVTVFLFAAFTMVLGLLTGWAWGCAAMAGALRARSQARLALQEHNVETGFASGANPDLEFQAAVFRAEFLDPGSSAVYGAFLFVGAYIFGLVRALKPKMMLGATFATIIVDVMTSMGPLIPQKNYTLPQIILIPASMYVAIALAASFLLWPQTVHHLFLDGMVNGVLRTASASLGLQDAVLSTTDPAKWTELSTKMREIRGANAAAVNGLEGQVGMLQLEVSRGRLSPGDLGDIFERVKRLCVRLYGLNTFVSVLERQSKIMEDYRHESSTGRTRLKKVFADMEEAALSTPRFEVLMPILQTCSQPLLSAAKTSLDDCIQWLDEINHSRWKSSFKHTKSTSERETDLSTLQTALAEFRQSKQFEVLEPLRDAFDVNGILKADTAAKYGASARDLFRCYVFTSGLTDVCLCLEELQRVLLQKEKATPKPIFQFPTAFSKMLLRLANENEGPVNPFGIGDRRDDTGVSSDASSSQDTLVDGVGPTKKKKRKTYHKDPDARDPRNLFQRFGRRLFLLWKGVTSNAGVFALKYAIVSVALWVPAVCPTTARFYYENRGLWALIMSQTGLGLYAGEQVFAFITRIIGTGIGLVFGMLAWYIGAAKGPGNPYGIAAITTVLMGPFLYLRIIAPLQYLGFALLTPVTFVFVVGYSWVDGHTFQTANQGVGAGLAGRRALLVLVGFAAAMIMMLLPKPISAKLQVRRSMAHNIGDIGELYGKIVDGFELEMEDNEKGEEVMSKVLTRVDQHRERFLAIVARTQLLAQRMGFAKIEPGLAGPWPEKEYKALLDVCVRLLGALGALSGAYRRINPVWCRRFIERSDLTDPTFVADSLSLFALLDRSLRHGTPLPPTMAIMERLAYHHMHNATLRSARVRAIPSTEPGLELAAQDSLMVQLRDIFTWDMCHDEQFGVFATAVVSLLHVTYELDDLYRTVAELVGERELEGFDRAQERWAMLDTQS